MIDRILHKNLEQWLFKGKTIVITGARQVGKTSLVLEITKDQKDVVWLNADEQIIRDRLTHPTVESLRQIIGAKRILVIDEIQRIENSGLLLKLIHDNFRELQVIATGSSALEITDKISEPLTGRHILFHLYPLQIRELYPEATSFEIEQKLEFHMRYGLYPEICMKPDLAETLVKQLSGQYLYKDVLIWKDIRKPYLLDRLLRLLAHQLGSVISIHELANALHISSETVENYIDLLEKSFVIFRLGTYSNNPRKEVTKSTKIFFWDLGVRNAVIDDFRDLNLRNDQGALFENLFIAERVKQIRTSHSGKRPFFWRNRNQSEVDYLEEHRGQLEAFEIKWNRNKNQKVSRAFKNQYPEAGNNLVNPTNLAEHLK